MTVPLKSHLISKDGITVELEVLDVLVDEAPPHEGHQVQEADGVQARVPPLHLLRQEDSLLALEQYQDQRLVSKFPETLSNLCDMVDLPQTVVEEEDELCVV